MRVAGYSSCVSFTRPRKFVFGKGLYLEDSEVLIPWGVTASDASAIGSPRVVTTPPRYDLIWGPERILDGMSSTVHAVLHGGQKLRRLSLEPTWRHETYNLERHYMETRDHLIRALGSPTHVDEDKFASMPSYSWSDPAGVHLRLWLFDRFGEQLMLEVGYPRKRRFRTTGTA